MLASSVASNANVLKSIQGTQKSRFLISLERELRQVAAGYGGGVEHAHNHSLGE